MKIEQDFCVEHNGRIPTRGNTVSKKVNVIRLVRDGKRSVLEAARLTYNGRVPQPTDDLTPTYEGEKNALVRAKELFNRYVEQCRQWLDEEGVEHE